MKRIILLIVIAGLFVALPANALRTSAQTAGMVSSVLRNMDRNKQNLKTLRANITMEKYNAQLREPDTYQGIVLYIPGLAGNAFVRLEWTKPQHETLVVANGNYTLYRPRLSMAYIGKTGGIKSQQDSDVLALMSMSAAQLRTKFGEFQDTREETLWGGIHTTHFTAVPKTAASYKYIEVWVDDSGMPVQTKMVEKNDDSTTVRLSEVEKNQNIPMDQFTLKLDASVKRVKG
jgi:outer membrane lipoprotein-sorting protein